MLVLSLVALAASAGPIDGFVEGLPASPSVVAGCSSAQAMQPLLNGKMFQSLDMPSLSLEESPWLDGAQPVWFAGIESDGPKPATVLELGVRDAAALAAMLESDPPGEVIEPGRSWTTLDGRQIAVAVTGDRARFTHARAESALNDTPTDLRPVLVAIDPSAPGCFMALGAPPAGAANPLSKAMGQGTVVAFRSFADDPDRWLLTASGMPIGNDLAVALRGAPATYAPMARGDWEPTAVIRVNGDAMATFLGMVRTLPGAPVPADKVELVSQQITDAGLVFGPGAEIAVQSPEAGGRVLVILPVERPAAAKSLPNKIRKALKKQGAKVEKDGKLIIIPDKQSKIWLGATDHHLVLATDKEAIEQVLDSSTTPWLAGYARAGEPGVVMTMSQPAGMLPMAGAGRVSGRAWVDEHGALWLDLTMPGLGAALAQQGAPR